MARTRRILRLNDVLSEFCMPLRPRAAHPGPYGRLYALCVLRSLFSLSTSPATARQESHVLFPFSRFPSRLSFFGKDRECCPFYNSGFSLVPFIGWYVLYGGCLSKALSKNVIGDFAPLSVLLSEAIKSVWKRFFAKLFNFVSKFHCYLVLYWE